MRLPRPSLEQTPHPRPTSAADVLLDIEDEQDDGVEFDPQRDIRQKDWEGMKGRLEELRRTENWWNFGFMAADLFLLSPDHKAELDLDEAFEGMKRELEESRGNDWGRFQFMVMNLSLLFPDRKDKLNLDNKVFEGIKRELERYRGTKDWWNFGDMAMLLALVFPDRKADLNLDDEVFEGMRRSLEELRGAKSWWKFSFIAMRLSLLFPDRKAELKLDHEAFEGMKRELEKKRGKDWRHFSDMALDLTILAADSAQITHDGRILIVPKRPRLSRDPKPLPKQSRL